jgi:hypothetical protein
MNVEKGQVLKLVHNSRTYVITCVDGHTAYGVTLCYEDDIAPDLAGQAWAWSDSSDFIEDSSDDNFRYVEHPDPDAAWADYCARLLTNDIEHLDQLRND